MIDLTRLKLYRRLRKLMGRPLKAQGHFKLPEGYYLLVEGQTVKLMKDCGWGSEVVQIFDVRTPFQFIKECTVVHWLGQMN